MTKPLESLCILAISFLAAAFVHNSAHAQAPPAQAAESVDVPPGFQVTLFAGEPDVVQPIAFTFDDRGRLWVVECLSYPDFDAPDRPRDRVTILEDTDGDGRSDVRKVFWDGGSNLTSIELGFGGVWLCSAPNLIFVPDRDRDDRPDGPEQILLDGWDTTARHNAVNGLIWGPDGWLYGLNGILSNSLVGPPGASEDERVPINCGVWRYHPTRRTFEAVAHGTTNPWGLDFNAQGRAFITNCVIKHAFHVVPGGRYERMFGQDLNRHAFDLIPSCADHIHWAGGYWDTEGTDKPVNDVYGGGHAHSGAMIYLGDNWPDQYRGRLFTVNIHGRRVNCDALMPRGSGYVARHEPDILRVGDAWFRGVALRYGPDGGVYIADWSDTGECHDYEEVERETGRIYKVVYGEPARAEVSIDRLSDTELVELHLRENDWHVRHARRVLQERATTGLSTDALDRLEAMIREQSEPARRLRALWSLHAVGGIDERLSLELLGSPDEQIRGWSAQLELEDGTASRAILDRLSLMARTDSSPVFRLDLACGLSRLPPDERGPIAAALVAHSEDVDDPNLPYLLWYGIEPLVADDPDLALDLLAACGIPRLRELIARRLVMAGGPESAIRDLALSSDDYQRDALAGIAKALEGRRDVSMPGNWPFIAEVLAESRVPEVRERALALSVVFGQPEALGEVTRIARDPSTDPADRARALASLVQQRPTDLPPLLQEMLDDPALRSPAIRSLAAYDDPHTPRMLLERFAGWSESERADCVGTLASRVDYAAALLDAVQSGKVARDEVSPFIARQIAALGDAALVERLIEVWGAIRPAAEGKQESLDRYRQVLSPERVVQADRERGRELFANRCGACHVLFNAGGRIGPDLTGAQRTSLDYLLENLLDPSAVVPRDYQVAVFETHDGRVLTGIVKEESEAAVSIQTANEVVILPTTDLAAREASTLSMMPEGLLDRLTDDQLRDLFAYVTGPPPAGP